MMPILPGNGIFFCHFFVLPQGSHDEKLVTVPPVLSMKKMEEKIKKMKKSLAIGVE